MALDLTDILVHNLKALNAKERDHLMRYAYLGVNTQYAAEAGKFLSDEFIEKLRGPDEDPWLDRDAKCVFAAMDYHLDWLFVAMKLAVEGTDLSVLANDKQALKNLSNLKLDQKPDGDDPLYHDFRPVMGNQEDLDLLAVFEDQARATVLFIEAKGSAAFDRVQLARKLIRLDRILVASGVVADGREPLLQYRLILASPKEPGFKEKDCRRFAQDLPLAASPEKDKFHQMRELLSVDSHSSRVGDGLHHVLLDGFPTSVLMVTRESYEEDSTTGEFTHWKVSKR